MSFHYVWILFYLVGGLNLPLWKMMEFVSWDDDIPNWMEKLDDGWPESVEEQGLLLLVWRHHITKRYIKDVLQADEKSIKTI